MATSNSSTLGAVVLISLLVAACSSGAPTGLAQEPQPDQVTATQTSRQLEELILPFGVALRSATGDLGDYTNPVSLTEIVDQADLVATGMIVSSEKGRRQPVIEDSNGTLFLAHFVLTVEIEEVIAGSIDAKQIRIQFEVPGNLKLDELVHAAPIGARVIVAGYSIATPTRAEAGLGPGVDVVEVPDNTYAVPPWGLVLESGSANDSTYLPFIDERYLNSLAETLGVEISTMDSLAAALEDAQAKLDSGK